MQGTVKSSTHGGHSEKCHVLLAKADNRIWEIPGWMAPHSAVILLPQQTQAEAMCSVSCIFQPVLCVSRFSLAAILKLYQSCEAARGWHRTGTAAINAAALLRGLTSFCTTRCLLLIQAPWPWLQKAGAAEARFVASFDLADCGSVISSLDCFLRSLGLERQPVFRTAAHTK